VRPRNRKTSAAGAQGAARTVGAEVAGGSGRASALGLPSPATTPIPLNSFDCVLDGCDWTSPPFGGTGPPLPVQAVYVEHLRDWHPFEWFQWYAEQGGIA
jgi:hypothetical protein